jgi:peptidoglycan/xylan/chitin deacetylase (PgdA/CDA1 family)
MFPYARPSRLLAALLFALSLPGVAALQPPAAAEIESLDRPVALQAAYRPSGSLPALGDRAFILCWHTFLGRPDISTDFSLAELGSQVDALLALGYRFISLEDLIFGRFSGSRNLVATLDDGHRTASSAYTKVFAARGITPALFVYPSVIGTTSYSLNEGQLQALRDSGCLIGAHGYYHLYVTDALYKSDRAAFEKEIFTAKEKVEAMTRLPIYVYAYPFGAFSPITRREVERAGYAFAFAVKRGFVFADSRLNDPYELPRSVVTRDNWGELYALLARNAEK